MAVRIFLCEYTTGGGLLSPDANKQAPSACDARPDAAHAKHLSELVVEGLAMLSALATDFGLLAHTGPVRQVTVLRDRRFAFPSLPGVAVRDISTASEFREAFDEESARADFTVVVAPECGGVLQQLSTRAAQVGGRSLGCSADLVALAGDKHRTAGHLARHGIPVPRGTLADDVQGIRALKSPLVVKPRDGAGSQDVRLTKATTLLADRLAHDAHWRVEEFCPGQPVSVALLCGPAGNIVLPACAQRLSEDGRFTYLGGSTPLEPAQAARAAQLAQRAAATFPGALGYIGFDLVLGECDSGADDVVIEINPRLTTSYIGLRAAVEQNLAATMLAVAAGDRPKLSSKDARVEFNKSGRITIC